MRAAPRFRLFSNRASGNADDEEGQEQDQYLRRRVSGARRSSPVTSRPFRVTPVRLSSCYSYLTRHRRVTLLLVLFSVAYLLTMFSFRLLFWVSKSPHDPNPGSPNQAPLVATRNLGPDAIPSVVMVERRGGHRRALGGDGLGNPRHLPNERDTRQVCLNTVQGMTLLTDSEGWVCPRTDQDPLRSGCCLRNRSVLNSDRLRDDRALSVIADGSDRSRAPTTNENAAVENDPADGVKNAERGSVGYELRVGVSTGNGEDARRRVLALPQSSDKSSFPVGFPPPKEAFWNAFSCWSCDVSEMSGGSSCCLSYEFCVSCCLDPRRADEREMMHAAAARSGHSPYDDGWFSRDNQEVQQQLSDGKGQTGGSSPRQQQEQERAFAQCAFRCRTNSGSVAHENSYRGPLKHCFGRFRPPTAVGMSPNSDGSRRSKTSPAALAVVDSMQTRDAAVDKGGSTHGMTAIRAR